MGDIKDRNIYYMQVVFVLVISVVSQNFIIEIKNDWLTRIARYVLYMQLISGSKQVFLLGNNVLQKSVKLDVLKTLEGAKKQIALVLGSTATLIYKNEKIITEEFLLLSSSYLVVKYFEIEKKSSMITYGAGMACNFFQGYLTHVIPSDGHKFVGFLENISKYEQGQGVVFPVRKLFIVIAKSLYCPPDLMEFNKENRDDLPSLESCKSLGTVAKDMAGVKNRQYTNSAYMIRRPGLRPVYLSVESATPLHTLHAVVNNRLLYKELSYVNIDEVVDDFCTTLRVILQNSPDCKGKCELVFFDDTDPQQNLADVLLDKIRELEPNFENISREH